MAVRSVVRRSGLTFSQCPDSRSLRRLFHQGAASLNAVFAYDKMGREFLSLLTVLATQQLSDCHVDVPRYNAPNFNLATDLANVLFWDFQLERLKWLEERLERMETMEAPSHEELVVFFESRRGRTEKLTGGLIHKLHRWLLELDACP